MNSPQAFKSQRHIDTLLRLTAGFFAVVLLIIVALLVITLGHHSLPSLKAFGLDFLVSADWNPVSQHFGALTPILGTCATMIIAMIIAVPMSLCIAWFLTELCPGYLQQTARVFIELLAGIPSIIYGMWGLFVLAPIFSDYVQPWMIERLSPIAVIGPFFQGPPLGIGIITAGVVLSIMIIPFMSSVMRDAFAIVPDLLKESAYAVGATRSEIARNIIFPYCRTSIFGGIILGLGRAIGETMAVAFVIGNSHQLSRSLFMPGSSITSVLANEFSEATGPLYISSLNELGLILLIITLMIFSVGKWLIKFRRP
jgi:phosphate transport system permease protein